MTANRLRGETAITLDEKTIVLRPTFDVLARIETALDCSFFGYVQKMSATTVRIADVAKVVAIAGDMTEAEAGQLIVDFGVMKFINGPFSEFMARAAGFFEDFENTGGTESAGK